MFNQYNSLYTFKSAKKLYLTKTSSSYLLIEKNEIGKGLSLMARNTIIISKQNGMLIFPKGK